MCRSCGKCIFLQVTTIYVCCSSLFLTFEGTQENCIPINSNIRNQLGYAFGDVRWDIALFLFLLGFTLLTMLVMRQMELVKESNKNAQTMGFSSSLLGSKSKDQTINQAVHNNVQSELDKLIAQAESGDAN